ILSYLFAFVNTVVALFVARGSERSLVARIGLAGFFVLERPLSAFIFGEKPIASVGTHLLTAAVELIILISAVRVWRLGHSLAARALMVVALILFLERSFSPFSLREQDPVVLALHGLAALVSLAVALATASAIRGRAPREPASVQTLEAA